MPTSGTPQYLRTAANQGKRVCFARRASQAPIVCQASPSIHSRTPDPRHFQTMHGRVVLVAAWHVCGTVRVDARACSIWAGAHVGIGSLGYIWLMSSSGPALAEFCRTMAECIACAYCCYFWLLLSGRLVIWSELDSLAVPRAALARTHAAPPLAAPRARSPHAAHARARARARPARPPRAARASAPVCMRAARSRACRAPPMRRARARARPTLELLARLAGRLPAPSAGAQARTGTFRGSLDDRVWGQWNRSLRRRTALGPQNTKHEESAAHGIGK